MRKALNGWDLCELADDAELVTGELLENVLLHTEGGTVLTLEVLPEPVRRARQSVQDRSSVLPRRRCPGETATSGRGLPLLAAVAVRWGIEAGSGEVGLGEAESTVPVGPTTAAAASVPAARIDLLTVVGDSRCVRGGGA